MFDHGFWLFARQVWHWEAGSRVPTLDSDWTLVGWSARGYGMLLRAIPDNSAMEHMIIGPFSASCAEAVAKTGICVIRTQAP